MNSTSISRLGTIGFGLALSALALAACSQEPKSDTTASTTPTETATPAATDATAAATPAAAPAAVAADNTDTLDGTKYASFTGDAAKGEQTFVACKTCHAIDKNMIGPHLKGVVGRAAGSIADYTYSAANKNSGITWTPEKLFQYLEAPQRIVPGTKMTYPGLKDAQKRADVIAYLKTQS
ncbi:MAG: cytochrome c family protein [Sphingomonas sp.]|nr:cytochrome c family protein [Sphingomonas sp.]